MDLENITIRKNRKSISMQDVSNSSLFETSRYSMPETSIGGANNCCEETLLQVRELNLKLSSANNEIDNMRGEIKQLRDDLQKCNDIIDMYRKTENVTPRRKIKITKTRKNNSRKSAILTTSSPKIDDNRICHQDINYQDKDTQQTENKSVHLENSQNIGEMTHKRKSKICIVSENRNNKIISIAENIIKEESEICHHLLPNCGIENMLTGLEVKLKKFTMNDYCIILIGETDFLVTKNYFNLILTIREYLGKIIHTNVILCAPTYKYSNYSMVYNWRVEQFNNLLYLDITSHQHAYFLDTNKNLACDNTMFWFKSGAINNYGMQIAFKDIAQYISDLKYYNNQEDKEAENQFFL